MTEGAKLVDDLNKSLLTIQAAERAISGLPTANQLSDIRSRILEEVREARKQEQSLDKAVIKGVKRKANGTSSSSKKAKTDDLETVNVSI